MTYSLKDYNEHILKPMALSWLRQGMFDKILFGEDIDEVYKNDTEFYAEILKRRAIVNKS